MRAEHVESRCGRRDRFGHRHGEGSVELSLTRYFDSTWKRSAVFAGGGHIHVAGVFEEDDGARGKGEGRGGDGSVRSFLVVDSKSDIIYDVI